MTQAEAIMYVSFQMDDADDRGRHAKPGESRPRRQSSTENCFGSYRDTPPDLEPVGGLGDVVVETRTSRQGRITIVNRGRFGRGPATAGSTVMNRKTRTRIWLCGNQTT